MNYGGFRVGLSRKSGVLGSLGRAHGGSQRRKKKMLRGERESRVREREGVGVLVFLADKGLGLRSLLFLVLFLA